MLSCAHVFAREMTHRTTYMISHLGLWKIRGTCTYLKLQTKCALCRLLCSDEHMFLPEKWPKKNSGIHFNDNVIQVLTIRHNLKRYGYESAPTKWITEVNSMLFHRRTLHFLCRLCIELLIFNWHRIKIYLLNCNLLISVLVDRILCSNPFVVYHTVYQYQLSGNKSSNASMLISSNKKTYMCEPQLNFRSIIRRGRTIHRASCRSNPWRRTCISVGGDWALELHPPAIHPSDRQAFHGEDVQGEDLGFDAGWGEEQLGARISLPPPPLAGTGREISTKRSAWMRCFRTVSFFFSFFPFLLPQSHDSSCGLDEDPTRPARSLAGAPDENHRGRGKCAARSETGQMVDSGME
jgi:hypothetical protein